jgi:hypothetical protein
MVVGTVEAGEDASLYRDLLADATFHQLLLACDADLADAARAGEVRVGVASFPSRVIRT